MRRHYDVVIIGAGLAGLSLARQLSLLSENTSILLVEKRPDIPPARQKVGESLVQVGGYYFAKVLDLEEHLLRRHFMKYNLRFYWKNAGRDNRDFEDYSAAYIRTCSNIATYQLDRNVIEAELLRLARENPRCTACLGVNDLDVSLSDDHTPHRMTFTADRRAVSVTADWVVDTSGRGRFLARRLHLLQDTVIRHGASFLWVDGLVDVERLTELSLTERRLKKERAILGHLPTFLGTNQFLGEGFWFWVIPLHGKTSLGVVYDNMTFPKERVSTPKKLIEWACEEFPLFVRDLPHRTILSHGSFKDFAYDCVQTIHSARWALAGEAGRFNDPLYSPGSDFIAIHNTLICDAILTRDTKQLADKCYLYELLVQSLYASLVPTFAVSYNTLGHQAAFVLKYTWELSVYFAFFVFPFINDLFTERRFVVSFLSRFSRLGQINQNIQSYLSAYYQWKRTQPQPVRDPVFHDFTVLEPLRRAERTFYRVGLSVDEARKVLDEQLASLTELARFLVAFIHSDVLADGRVLTNRPFIERLDLRKLHFDPERMREHYARYARASERYEWTFDPCVLDHFRVTPETGDMRVTTEEAVNE